MNLLFPPFGYASTFYRFKYFFSLLKKRQPQIVADIPHRINKNELLPTLVIIKDSNHFPCELLEIEIFIDKRSINKKVVDKKVNQNYWELISQIDISKFETRWHEIDIKIIYKLKGKTFSCYNDNYRTTSHSAFPCYFSEEKLPVLEGFIAGDMHSHSNFTDDQIEFGASLETSSVMAATLGLDFFAITDHSYDLDDYPDNFLKNDPNLNKWNSFLKNVEEKNASNDKTMIIPGEEVSVRNSKNETVHLLVYNDKNYFPGCGDSGERWFHYFSKLSISDVLKSSSKNTAVFASHPTDHVPSAHRLLLNRGHWDLKDAQNNMLTGVQIFNGHGANKINDAVSFWKSLLLKGYKSFILAGNDGHGNFGRNRYISIPFLKINESYSQLFGKWRTDIYLGDKEKTVDNIIQLLKAGNFAVSNGPAIDLQIFDENKLITKMGHETDNAINGKVVLKSSPEFGAITKLDIYQGFPERSKEVLYLTKDFNKYNFELNFEFEIKENSTKSYLRAEIQSSGPKGKHFAFTNPIWITPVKKKY